MTPHEWLYFILGAAFFGALQFGLGLMICSWALRRSVQHEGPSNVIPFKGRVA